MQSAAAVPWSSHMVYVEITEVSSQGIFTSEKGGGGGGYQLIEFPVSEQIRIVSNGAGRRPVHLKQLNFSCDDNG